MDNILKNCMGVANDGVELAVLTGDGKIVTTPNIEGQICVKSKMNMQEYYMEPELTKVFGEMDGLSLMIWDIWMAREMFTITVGKVMLLI
ncbi:MAG: long-chain fatty acid--CoA ligase [Clostridiales bacterium]|nr:MAG: long-chain fatty acid--CoA ligase [Clostridiales bacterium]